MTALPTNNPSIPGLFGDMTPMNRFGMGLLGISDALFRMAGKDSNQQGQAIQQQLMFGKFRDAEEEKKQQAELREKMAAVFDQRGMPDQAEMLRSGADLGNINEFMKLMQGPDKNVWEAKRDALIQSNVDPDIALGIVTGSYKSVTDPLTGQTSIIDLRGKRVANLTPDQANIAAAASGSPGNAAAGNGTAPLPPTVETSPLPTSNLPTVDFSQGTGATGFFGNIANIAADLVGFDLPAKEVQKSIDAFRAVNNQAIAFGTDDDGRETNFTRQLAQSLNIEPASLFMGDQRAQSKLEAGRDMIQRRLEVLRGIANDPKAGPTNRRKAFTKIKSGEELLSSLEHILSLWGAGADPEIDALINQYAD